MDLKSSKFKPKVTMFEVLSENSEKVIDKMSFDVAKLLNLLKAKNIKTDSIVIKSENGTSTLKLKVSVKVMDNIDEADKNDLEKKIFDLEQ